MTILEILYELHMLLDWAPYWRVVVGLALTGLACWIVVLLTPDGVVRWMACAPIAVGGVWASVQWQRLSVPASSQESAA